MIHVAAAVIRAANGRILIARRHDHLHQGGLWEFPGGKREVDETREQTLERELLEELGIHATDYRPLIQIPHHYPDKSVFLDVWQVTGWQGQLHGKENQEIRWVSEAQLADFDFPAANQPILKACRLPTEYLITPAIEGTESDFIRQMQKALDQGVSMVQYRQKGLPVEKFEKLAARVVDACHEAGARVLLNSSAWLVEKLRADGVQINAAELMSLSYRPLPENYLVAASCHNREELDRASELGLDFAMLSPVLKTASHPDASPLGWQHFQDLVSEATIPVYALGGVSRAHTREAWESGAQGISAIRALWQAE